jgi:hypothetical protein
MISLVELVGVNSLALFSELGETCVAFSCLVNSLRAASIPTGIALSIAAETCYDVRSDHA